MELGKVRFLVPFLRIFTPVTITPKTGLYPDNLSPKLTQNPPTCGTSRPCG